MSQILMQNTYACQRGTIEIDERKIKESVSCEKSGSACPPPRMLVPVTIVVQQTYVRPANSSADIHVVIDFQVNLNIFLASRQFQGQS